MAGHTSMSKRAFDEKLAALEALRSKPESAAPAVRKTLAGRSNFLAAKAAALAADLHLAELIPDLAAAFGRFPDAAADPQCWAKHAIVKALKDLAHREPDVFLRGLRHVQMEPVYGGRSDSAATLRGACALALIECRIDDLTLLNCLAEALADSEKVVRVDAAVALSSCGVPEASALLRLKALSGDPEPEVTGQCLASLLSLSPDAVDFAARFLDSPDADLQIEAVAALAQSPAPAALPALRRYWEKILPPEVRRAAHTILAASRHREAFPPPATGRTL